MIWKKHDKIPFRMAARWHSANAESAMDPKKFTEHKTGRLVPITIPDFGTDYAFVPQPLPPSWTPEHGKLWPMIAEARENLGKLDGIGRALPSPSLLLRPLQRREAIKSNSIEGTYVKPVELLLFEAERQQSGEAPSSPREDDWFEVFRYDQALQEGCKLITAGNQINWELICQLHGVMLRSGRGQDKQPGRIRERQVYVSGSRYVPPPPEELAPLLADWENYVSTPDPTDALVRAYFAHYQFEALHPYEDGNGRIGRLLLSLCVFKWLGHVNAWLYLSEFFERNRAEYISLLFAVSADGAWNEWVKFCLVGTIEQARAAVDKCAALQALKSDYESRAAGLSTRMYKILNRLFANPIVEISKLAAELDVDYKTAQRDIEKLVEIGIMKEFPGLRPRTFSADAVFRIAYLD